MKKEEEERETKDKEKTEEAIPSDTRTKFKTHALVFLRLPEVWPTSFQPPPVRQSISRSISLSTRLRPTVNHSTRHQNPTTAGQEGPQSPTCCYLEGYAKGFCFFVRRRRQEIRVHHSKEWKGRRERQGKKERKRGKEGKEERERVKGREGGSDKK